jgi:ferredoxin-thioredoxin reductase catalytic subunit
MKWYEKFAQKQGLRVNDEMKDTILTGLMANQEKHGARFCPCKIELVTDNICPCGEVRSTNKCHCGLFVKEDK